MKFYIQYLVLFASLPMFAQVGINTQTPETALEVRATNHMGAVTSKDGVLVPRVNALAANGAVNGQLVYLIQDSGTFTKGFHFWDGSAWKGVTKKAAGDISNDEWLNNSSTARVHLPKLSDGITARPEAADFVVLDNGKIGIGTAAPMGALELLSTNAGLLLPRMTVAQRDALTANYRQTGTMIYNTSDNVMQANTGTSELPVWEDLVNLIPDTQNTYAIWQKTTSQSGTNIFLNFNTTPFFSNIPTGYVTQTTSSTWTLTPGKTYEINYDQGFVNGTLTARTCVLYTDASMAAHSQSTSVPSTRSNFWSGGTTGMTIVQPTAPTTISLNCSSGGSSNPYGGANPFPWISFKMLD